jgi:transcriptional regulator with XRE-family HTH domain
MELRIKDIVKEKRFTSVWLASQIGITQPSMSNIVNGKIKPSLDTLERIATALNVPVTDLFDKPATDVVFCPKCGAKLTLQEKL